MFVAIVNEWTEDPHNIEKLHIILAVSSVTFRYPLVDRPLVDSVVGISAWLYGSSFGPVSPKIFLCIEMADRS